jgi:hypothetical protein
MKNTLEVPRAEARLVTASNDGCAVELVRTRAAVTAQR